MLTSLGQKSTVCSDQHLAFICNSSCNKNFLSWQWEIHMKLLQIQVKHQTLLWQKVNVWVHVMNLSQIVLLFFKLDVVFFCPRQWFQDKDASKGAIQSASAILSCNGVPQEEGYQKLSAWAPGRFCCKISNEVAQIDPAMMGMKARAVKCIAAGGGHFENCLWGRVFQYIPLLGSMSLKCFVTFLYPDFLAALAALYLHI